MNKLTKILIAVLLGQVVLVLVLNSSVFTPSQSDSKDKVLTADLKKTDSVKIIDKVNSKEVSLKKVGNSWTVPEVMGFPASTKTVEELINKFTNMDGGWPVATSSQAAKRFKVTKDDFELSVVYQSAGKDLAQVFIGTSPNYKVRNVRSSNSKNIYAVAFGPADLTVKPKSWVDKSAYTVSADDISKVELADISLSDENGSWQLKGLSAGEVTNQTIARNTVDTLSSIVFKSVESDKDDPEFGLDAPIISFSIYKKDGTKIDYSLGKRKVNDGFILKSSDKKFYVSVDRFVVENIKKLNRVSLVAKDTLKDAKTKAGKAEPAKESSTQGTN